MMKLPLAHIDVTVVEEIPVDLWSRLFDEVGWLPSLGETELTHEAILLAFDVDDPSDGLLQALEAIHHLGHESGREAIVEALSDLQIERGQLLAERGERELAVHLFLAQRDDPVIAEAFDRAQVRVQESERRRSYNDYLGRHPVPVGDLARSRGLLERGVLEICRAEQLGDHVQVRAYKDDDVYVFHVMHTYRTRKPLAVVPGRRGRAAIEFRPVHGDVIRYDSRLGRLRVAARAPSLVPMYQRLMGEIIDDDDQFFSNDAVCSLDVLQRRGQDALLDHDVPGIGRVRMTECTWIRGDNGTVQIKSDDCFREIEQLENVPLRQGMFVAAKLKVPVAQASTRPVTVTIRVPRRIDLSSSLHQDLIEQYLDEVGITTAARPDHSSDLWDLAPWRHPRSVWVAAFGSAAADRMVEAGALRPVRLRAVPHPAAPDAGPGLRPVPLAAGGFYGVSDTPEHPSQTLSETDLDGLELSPEQLRQTMARALGVTPASRPGRAGDDFLSLGVIEVGQRHFSLFLQVDHPRPDLADRLRRDAVDTECVVLVPPGRDEQPGVSTIRLPTPLPARRDVVRRIAAAHRLEDQLPATDLARELDRLVVDTRRGQVWVDGVLIPDLRGGTQPFQLVEELARACPDPVPTSVLARRLSPSRGDGNTAARVAKNAAKKAIGAALTKAGRELEPDLRDPFPPSPARHYRCTLAAFVR